MLDIKYFKDGTRHVICLEDGELADEAVKKIISSVVDARVTEVSPAASEPLEPAKEPNIPSVLKEDKEEIKEDKDVASAEIKQETKEEPVSDSPEDIIKSEIERLNSEDKKEQNHAFAEIMEHIKQLTDATVKKFANTKLAEYVKIRFENTNASEYANKLNVKQLSGFLSDTSFGGLVNKKGYLTKYGIDSWEDFIKDINTEENTGKARKIVEDMINRFKS